MLKFVGFLFLSSAFGQLVHHHQSPSGGMLIPAQVDQLFATADKNHDGDLSFPEFEAEFIGTFDHDGNGEVSESEFVQQWQHNYHENHYVTTHVFQHFDLDQSKVLTVPELTELFEFIDHNKNQQINKSEFHHLMFYIFGRLDHALALG